MRREKNHRGFTIIELVAVAALIALIASVSLLRFVRMENQSAIGNDIRQLYLAARYARIAAIEQQRVFYLLADVARHRFLIVQEPASDETQTADTGLDGMQSAQASDSVEVKNEYARPYTLAPSLMIEQFLVDGVENAEMRTAFYPDGQAQAAVIQLGDGIRHASVIIMPSGRVKMSMDIADARQTGRFDLDAKE